MQKKKSKVSQKAGRTRSPSVKSDVSSKQGTTPDAAAKAEAARARFVEHLLIRGKAAKPTKEGKLPLRATHVILEEGKGGTKVKRVRFNAF